MPTKATRKKAPPSPLWKKPVLIILGVAAVGFGGLGLTHFIFKPSPQAKVLQAALADQFNSSPEAVVPNLPSRAGRYPGAVLAVTEKGSELLVRRGERPEVVPPVSGALKAVRLSDANAAWQLAGKAFGGSLKGEGSATVEVDLENVRIFEEEAGKLAEALRADNSVSRARSTGQAVVVITRAYEAIPVVTVKQNSTAKSEDWAKLKDQLTKAKGEITSDNSVVFRSSEPQVVAYETSDAKLIAGNFSAGDGKLELKRRLATNGGTSAAPRPEDLGAKAAGEEVAFAVVTSSAYSHDDFGDLPEALSSAVLASELFQMAGAQALETGLKETSKLTVESFAAARERLKEALKAKKPKAFVLYYAGHAVSGMAGAQYLVMGDYQGKLAEDLQQTTPFVPPSAANGPLAGSNISDLMKVVAAAGQELATSAPGLVSVADIHRDFSEAGVPFALVIDGCYAASAMDDLRKELSLTPWGDYYGTDGRLAGDLQTYHQALKAYGEAPYLRSANPVILAARPGTVAQPQRHPFFESDLVPGVAPLSAKLLGTYLYAMENGENLSLGVWLRRITDFAGTGELDVKGSISWSDFEALRKVPMVKFNEEAKP